MAGGLQRFETVCFFVREYDFAGDNADDTSG